ncbi:MULTISPECIES: conjugal transfer protein TraD [Chryseobacterium group]|uniref:Conjugal transfer protein TraD n=1 Tax=Chryseobacterium salviniae TaxID=3101750 RepID=A0ABU6HQ78_9FLAO|nr:MULTISPECIES: conjugal transfer protein TraD [Chryseobacterium group]MDV3879064.1 conjugal transfer protein TraD [Elizabethkingia anophelis]MEC3874844.1 conjugal transfer protein TraD [Chryseobacterium sp. T9W2-O]
MEIVIVICLLIVIALLLQDKIVIKRKSEQKPKQEKVNPKLPDIMGQPKPVRSQSVPNTANESQMAEPEVDVDNLDIEYDENENVGIQIPQEELDKVFSNNVPDLAEEEEDLNRYRTSGSDDGFAQGVTFEELNNVGVLLQKETLEPAQKETAIDIVQRLQGTELFALLESSMQGASRKIAELLDSTLSSSDTETSSSNLRKNDLSDFDIADFI